MSEVLGFFFCELGLSMRFVDGLRLILLWLLLMSSCGFWGVLGIEIETGGFFEEVLNFVGVGGRIIEDPAFSGVFDDSLFVE